MVVGAFFTALFGVGSAGFGRGVFDLGVYFTADQYRRASEVEPEHQHDNRAQRSIRRAVGVEEVQVELESERREQPQHHTNY